MILAFNRVTASPKLPVDIAAEGIDSILRQLKNHDYQAINPENLADLITQGYTGRNFALAFKNIHSETLEQVAKIHAAHALKPLVFLNPETIGVAGNASASYLSQMAADGICNFGLIGDTTNAQLQHQQLEKILQTTVNFFTYDKQPEPGAYPVASAAFKIAFISNSNEVGLNSDLQAVSMLEYVKGAAEAGAAAPGDWLPPKSARNGALTITLSILVYFIAFSWYLKAMGFLRAARALRAAAIK